MLAAKVIPSNPDTKLWDVVVIGTGPGGATAGYRLAQRGYSVLFLERGKLLQADATVIKGKPFSPNGNSNAALRHGWSPSMPECVSHATPAPKEIPMGCGTGGSTALFSMVMDRFRPSDFSPGTFFPQAEGSSLPPTWPISYKDLEPYYEQAEALYRIRGTCDPLAPAGQKLLNPPAPSAKELDLFETLTSAGLHPYRIHYACEHVPNCSGCWFMLCPHDCRNDAGKICVKPALEDYGAQILPGCEVLSLEQEKRVVRRAVCNWNGGRISIQGRMFILACNAFFTPSLLRRSADRYFPHGLANSSGMLGRNLMMHLSDLLLAEPKRQSISGDPMNHGISLTDFYIWDREKLGSIHVHPSSTTVFATIVEDLPYHHNRVVDDPGSSDKVSYEYCYSNELRHRNKKLLEAFDSALSPHFKLKPLRPLGMLNVTHACGTCRFGDDPRTSVLDRDNRAHDLDNVYVVDASFFPSSGGINPSLTIVANSLRVSDRIACKL